MKLLLALLITALGASAAIGEVYTWKDKKGTVFYTNSLHEIPARYLNKARVLDVATGKKGGLATAQPVTPPAPAPGQAPPSHSRPLALPAPAPVAPAPAPAPVPAQAAPTPAPAVANPAVEPAPAAAASRSQQRPVTGEQRRQSRRRSSASEE